MLEIPEWKQFEIPAIFASYFDPLIICSILRWLEKEECWWGREVTRSGDVIASLLKQYADERERAVLLSELLLAAAMGKVPGKAIEVVVDRSNALIGEVRAGVDPEGADVNVEALVLGLALLELTGAPVNDADGDDSDEGTEEPSEA